MNNQFNRRDFLKLASLLPLGMTAPRMFRTVQQGQQKNVLVIVFDAWSATNVSVYGYERETTPNLKRLAQRAIRYHNHYASESFTSAGTATLLTGVLPWRHRALLGNGEVIEYYKSRNIFTALPDHYGIAYTHNNWANTLLRQFMPDIDEYIPSEQLMLSSFGNNIKALFSRDEDLASVGWTRTMKVREEGHAYSLFLSHIYEYLEEQKVKNLQKFFPRGLPTTTSDNGFTVEEAVDYLTGRLQSIPKPFAGYFHFLPPHYPYHTSGEFVDAFLNDGYKAVEKPVDIFGVKENMNYPLKRRIYDEYILYCDQEFARLYNILETSGLLENTYIILTSDHGESFERGLIAHNLDSLYQPVIRVPLMIFEPGRTEGMDVYDNTSNADIVPTLTHFAGTPFPDWTEGVVLPPFAQQPSDRQVNVTRGYRIKDGLDPLTRASLIQVRENYKLHYYYGYDETPGDGLTRLFDVKADPEELNDLAKVKPETVAEMLHELKRRLQEADAPYRKS